MARALYILMLYSRDTFQFSIGYVNGENKTSAYPVSISFQSVSQLSRSCL